MDDIAKYTDLLGKSVTVTIDRPLGSRHPKLGFVYEVNYGFVPDTTAGDGHEIDAWVLGVDEPLEQITGRCIAVVIRHDDNENKLVINSERLTEVEILAKIDFVEKYYQTTVILCSE